MKVHDVSPLAEALHLRSLGLSVIPLHVPGILLPKGRVPDGAGKAPRRLDWDPLEKGQP